VTPALLCRQRNLEMMREPSRWPLYPFLPLRRDRLDGDEGPDSDLGILYDTWGSSRTPGYSATVFCENWLFLPATEELLFELPREVFDTVEEVFDAGWRVD
jgi:hypothetical protein